jgi:hypothetical protein
VQETLHMLEQQTLEAVELLIQEHGAGQGQVVLE